MASIDFRLLCTALGFAAVIMGGEKLSKKEAAARAYAFAGLIEKFCREAAPEGFTSTPFPSYFEHDSKLAMAGRLASAIVKTTGEKGGCLPQDLTALGFTPEEVDRHWAMARALAYVEMNKKDRLDS